MIKKKIDYVTKKISIKDFSSSKLQDERTDNDLRCVRMYNLNTTNGIIKRGMGIQQFMVHDSNDTNSVQYPLDCSKLGLSHINKLMHFKQYFANGDTTIHRLLIHGSDNKLYLYQMFSNLNSPSWVYGLEFDNIPAVLEYKKDGLDSILISANDKLVVWSTGRTPYELTNVPTITSMCVYNDELFCTIAGESDKIWYTENLDPESVGTESDTTKYIVMEGSAGGGQKIVLLKENMYVFCDYGIGRINTYAKSEPTYHQIYLTNGKICPNTVSVCGDVAIFLTQDGLYKFNGSTVSRIESLHNQLTGGKTEYAVATSLNDNYYLATNLEFNDDSVVGCELSFDYKNNALIRLDTRDYSFEITRGVDIKDMLALKAGVEEKVVLTFNTLYQYLIGEIVDEGVFFEDCRESRFCTNYFSLPNMERLTIRKIKIDTSTNLSVLIITENNKYHYYTNIEGINEQQVIIPCKKFKIDIISNQERININSLEIEYIVND